MPMHRQANTNWTIGWKAMRSFPAHGSPFPIGSLCSPRRSSEFERLPVYAVGFSPPSCEKAVEKSSSGRLVHTMPSRLDRRPFSMDALPQVLTQLGASIRSHPLFRTRPSPRPLASRPRPGGLVPTVFRITAERGERCIFHTTMAVSLPPGCIVTSALFATGIQRNVSCWPSTAKE